MLYQNIIQKKWCNKCSRCFAGGIFMFNEIYKDEKIVMYIFLWEIFKFYLYNFLLSAVIFYTLCEFGIKLNDICFFCTNIDKSNANA